MIAGLLKGGGRDPEQAQNERLDVLLADYAEVREDERTFQSQQGNGIALALTAISVLGAIAFTQGADPGRRLPDPIIAGAPLIVLAVLSYVQASGALAVLRSFYLRALEREIREELGRDQEFQTYQGLKVASYSELVAAFTSLNPDTPKGRALVQSSMATAVFGATWVVFGGMVIFLMTRVSLAWILVMVLVYGVSALALVLLTFHVNRRGRAVFAEHVGLLEVRMQRDLKPWVVVKAKDERALISYLLYPRPDDAIKGVFLLCGILLAAFVGPGFAGFGWSDFVQIVAIWVGSEFLLYQARYQWNDIRGHGEDLTAPTALARGRLPDTKGAVGLSWIVVAFRLYLVGILCAIEFSAAGMDLHVARSLGLALVGVALLALAYEQIRGRLARTRTSNRLELAWLLGIVGLGYPLRFTIGWLAVTTDVGASFWICLLALWALGVSFVATTWVLEAASYGDVATVGNSRSLFIDESAIAAKPHLRALLDVARIPVLPVPVPAMATDTVPGEDVKVLKQLARPSWRTPWALGTAVWLACVAAVGGDLAGVNLEIPLWVSILAALSVLMLSGVSSKWSTWLGQVVGPLIVLLAYVTVVAQQREDLDIDSLADWGRIALGCGLLLPATLVYLSFLGQSYANTRAVFQGAMTWMGDRAKAGYRWLNGDHRRP